MVAKWCERISSIPQYHSCPPRSPGRPGVDGIGAIGGGVRQIRGGGGLQFPGGESVGHFLGLGEFSGGERANRCWKPLGLGIYRDLLVFEGLESPLFPTFEVSLAPFFRQCGISGSIILPVSKTLPEWFNGAFEWRFLMNLWKLLALKILCPL